MGCRSWIFWIFVVFIFANIRGEDSLNSECELFCQFADKRNISDLTITCPTKVRPANPAISGEGQRRVIVEWEAPNITGKAAEPESYRQIYGLSSGSEFPSGEHEIIYTAWNSFGVTRSCSLAFSVIVNGCPRPESPEHGFVKCSQDGELVEGDTCEFTCKPGYTPTNSTSICQGNGTWDVTPACIESKCSAPEVPLNGQLDFCTTQQLPYSYSTVCVYRCDDGYQLPPEGVGVITCSDGGDWDATLTNCQDSSQPEFTYCPSDIVKYVTNKKEVIVSWIEPEVKDNHDVSITPELISGQQPGSKFAVGIHTTNYTAIDSTGNVADPCVFTIKITDKCVAGEYSKNGKPPCTQCVQSKYQPLQGQVDCNSCPPGMTSDPGASDLDSCYPFDLVFEETSRTESIEKEVNLENFTITFAIKPEPGSTGVILTLKHWLLPTVTIENPSNLTMSTAPSSGIDIADGQWHHVAVTWEGGDVCKLILYNKTNNESITPEDNKYCDMKNKVIFDLTLGSTANDSMTGRLTSFSIWDEAKSSDWIRNWLSQCTNDDSLASSKWQDFILSNRSTNFPSIKRSQCGETSADVCVPNLCNNNTCLSGDDEFVCICDEGVTGSSCETILDVCNNNACQNGGTCLVIPENQNYTCSCPRNYKGILCEVYEEGSWWSDWSEWSACSMSCGSGVRTRQRVCNNDQQVAEGGTCEGDLSDTEECNTEECRSCFSLTAEEGQALECSKNGTTDECILNCNDGWAAYLPIPAKYVCGPLTNYQWSHQLTVADHGLPRCYKTMTPEGVTLEITLTYESLQCRDAVTLNKNFQDFIIEEIIKLTSSLCDGITGCTEHIRASSCHQNADDVLQAMITLNVVSGAAPFLPERRMLHDGDSLDSWTAKINKIKKISRDLKEATAAGDLSLELMEGVRHSPRFAATGSVQCKKGTMPVGGFCGSTTMETIHPEAFTKPPTETTNSNISSLRVEYPSSLSAGPTQNSSFSTELAGQYEASEWNTSPTKRSPTSTQSAQSNGSGTFTLLTERKRDKSLTKSTDSVGTGEDTTKPTTQTSASTTTLKFINVSEAAYTTTAAMSISTDDKPSISSSQVTSTLSNSEVYKESKLSEETILGLTGPIFGTVVGGLGAALLVIIGLVVAVVKYVGKKHGSYTSFEDGNSVNSFNEQLQGRPPFQPDPSDQHVENLTYWQFHRRI